MRQLFVKLSFCLMLIVLVFAPGNALARQKSIIWQKYDVDIAIQSNGDLRVTETQVIEFQGGAFTAGFAAIPKENTDAIVNVSVAEPGQTYTQSSGGGGDYTFTVSDEGSEIYIEWTFPPLANETRTFLLSYTVQGAIRQYDDHDVLQFQAVSDQLEFPALSSTITVQLPPGGPLIQDPDSVGALVQWQISDDSQSVTYTSTETIQPYDGVGIGLIFQHGAISGPKPLWQQASDREAARQEEQEQMRAWLSLGLTAIGILLLLALPAALYLIWYLGGRDPKTGLAPEYIAEAPSGTPPGLVGTLVDEKADLRDLTATLIDLARRGVVTLEEREAQGAFGVGAKSFILKKNGEPQGLRRYEQLLYDAVFAGQAERDLSKMPETFFAQMPALENALYEAATQEGLFPSNPNSARNGYSVAGAVILVLTLVVGFCVLGSLAEYTGAAICPFIPLAGFGIGLVILSRAMPVKTRKGAEEAAKWKAFQTYLGNIQKYRNLAEATDQFEKYLPYAIAFGLERRWVNAFAQAPNLPTPVPMPIWYRPYRPVAVPGIGSGPAGSIVKEAGSGQSSAPGQSGGMPGGLPGLNQMGSGMIGGLNSIGDGLIGALNTAGRSFSTPPPPKYSGGGSRGTSGGSRSFGSGSRGGGFRSGGGGFRSGGGRRGFR